MGADEWQCRTWGSGRGRGGFEDFGLFLLIAKSYDLPTARDVDRDVVTVLVRLEHVEQSMSLVELVGEETECWPWLQEEEHEDQLLVAAQTPGLTPESSRADQELLVRLCIDVHGGRERPSRLPP